MITKTHELAHSVMGRDFQDPPPYIEISKVVDMFVAIYFTVLAMCFTYYKIYLASALFCTAIGFNVTIYIGKVIDIIKQVRAIRRGE
jgi:hypothetical protein